MGRLTLSVATGDYDRTRPLIDGSVAIDGVTPIHMALDPEEIFFRAFRHAEFDVCELSLSSFTIKAAAGTSDYVGVPVFPSRAFRHTAITIRTDRGIRTPQDLRGRRVGLPEYQLTACVWARALLQEDFGVAPEEITWVRGGIEQPGRPEKIAVALPPGLRVEAAPDGVSLSQLLAAGGIDALVSPRAPSCHGDGVSPVGWLFADPMAAAQDYFRRTGIFPIMHLLGVRRSLAEAHPWLPAALLKAFTHAKQVAEQRLADTSATKVTLPFVEEQLAQARALMGPDFWAYGVAPNRTTLDAFLRHHHAQGLSPRRLAVEELFHPATLETVKV
jgi:4,5-dihydroxyphthalate decarboxylase